RALFMMRMLYLYRNHDDPSRDQMVEESLRKLQERIEADLARVYYRVPKPIFLGNVAVVPMLEHSYKPEKKKRSPEDKVNRVIFITHEHLKHVTGGSPQWSDCL